MCLCSVDTSRHDPTSPNTLSMTSFSLRQMMSIHQALKSLVGFTSNITSVSFPMLCVRANLPVQPVS